jgi:catechol 2,3-dioxygenase-like lactoylglutathione lyase family enzyme
MAFVVDHIVIAVKDLDRAVANYRSLGFTVHPGGVHHGGVSHNALIVFADGSYVELIAFREDAPANRWWQILKAAGERIVDFALLPDDIDADLAAVIARGLDLEGPIAGGRLRPDGVAIEWQIARPSTWDLPFWCYDVTPRVLRVPGGPVRQHANGATGMSAIQIAVNDMSATRRRYHALTGALDQASLGSTLRIGKTDVELLGPDRDGVRREIEVRGEGIFSVTLRGLHARLATNGLGDVRILHGD